MSEQSQNQTEPRNSIVYILRNNAFVRRRVFIALALTILAIALFNFVDIYRIFFLNDEFLRLPVINEILLFLDAQIVDGITTEALGIFFTYVVIEYFRAKDAADAQYRLDKLEKSEAEKRATEAIKAFKKDLIRKVRSRSNNNAIDAIEIIRDEGWLDSEDGLLQWQNLKGANWEVANLLGANLRGTTLTNATLINTDMRDTLLIKADFAKSELRGTKFAGSSLAAANFEGAHLVGCIFKSRQEGEDQYRNDAKLIDEEIDEGINFSQAVLEPLKNENDQNEIIIDFSNMALGKGIFNGATLNDVDFENAQMENAQFINIKTEGEPRFDGANLKGAKFNTDDGNMYEIEYLKFRAANLMDAQLQNIRFNKVQFNEAKLQHANFSRSQFDTGCDFSGANMKKAIVDQSEFKNVWLSESTIFFNGEAIGEILINELRRLPENVIVNNRDTSLDLVKPEFIFIVSKILDDKGVKVFKATISIQLKFYHDPQNIEKGEIVVTGQVGLKYPVEHNDVLNSLENTRKNKNVNTEEKTMDFRPRKPLPPSKLSQMDQQDDSMDENNDDD